MSAHRDNLLVVAVFALALCVVLVVAVGIASVMP